MIRRVNSLRAILREGPPLTITDLALDGADLKDLGLPPGPRFGEVLRFLLDEVLDRPEENNRADLEALALKGGFLTDPTRDAEADAARGPETDAARDAEADATLDPEA